MSLAEARPDTTVFDKLLDPDSFVPIRTHVRSATMPEGSAGDGVTIGEGRINGRRVFWYEQDPTVLGGSLGETHADSICRILDLAGRFGDPVIGVHRSGGARIQEGVAALAGYGRIFARHVRLRKRVPQLAVVFGPCAGGASYGPALMDFVLMSRAGAYMFLTGPDVVREVTGEEVSFDELGGARVTARSGLASLVGDDEAETLELTRRLFAFLPRTIGLMGVADTWRAPDADPGRVVPDDPKATYDVRDVVRGVVDVDSLLELRADDAPNLVVGLATLEGRTIGVVANQPRHLAGSIDIDASRKGAWFVDLCDRFGFPIAVFVDTPGFLPGTAQELGGVIPAGASFLAAFVEATVPKATVVLRKAYGGAYIVMNSRDLGADYSFAWPSAEIAVLGARGAVKILERKRLTSAPDPEALRAELEGNYRERYLSPWPAAQAGFIDEVIEPAHTRARLVSALIP
ncbi:MAG TPA: carboxyl transferase domain-containing protein [Actinomycetota bacterium]|jgi:propionyl-CoA carboxylase beta chain|nr:carboxyl transferase domain-containing protein [Actinomycetota bacterium]